MLFYLGISLKTLRQKINPIELKEGSHMTEATKATAQKYKIGSDFETIKVYAYEYKADVLKLSIVEAKTLIKDIQATIDFMEHWNRCTKPTERNYKTLKDSQLKAIVENTNSRDDQDKAIKELCNRRVKNT